MSKSGQGHRIALCNICYFAAVRIENTDLLNRHYKADIKPSHHVAGGDRRYTGHHHQQQYRVKCSIGLDRLTTTASGWWRRVVCVSATCGVLSIYSLGYAHLSRIDATTQRNTLCCHINNVCMCYQVKQNDKQTTDNQSRDWSLSLSVAVENGRYKRNKIKHLNTDSYQGMPG